jgi:hypothetical protein
MRMLDKEEEQRTAECNEKVSVNADALKTQIGNQAMPDKEADSKENRPELPRRNVVDTGRDPLGADNDLTTSKDVRFEDALAATLARYIKQEDQHKFRCRVPECQKLFKAEHFWRKHIGVRHSEWLEGIKQEARSAAYSNDVQKREEYVIPLLQDQATPKREEEDLMSFDKAPKDIKPKDEAYIPERRKQQGIIDMPEEQHETLETHDESHRIGIDMSDDEESHGITMVDNEEEGITMLEPIPWTEDEETETHDGHVLMDPKENTRQETAHTRVQDAWDRLDLGKQ